MKPSPYIDTKAEVANRGAAPDKFLDQLIETMKLLPVTLFEPNPVHDIYTNLASTLGPWRSTEHRRAVMAEALRVLGGFESSWKWTEGVDRSNKRSQTHITGQETGLWQVSYDSLAFGEDLKECARRFAGTPLRVQHFIDKMKTSHPFAIEYVTRLLRHTVNHHGPVKRHEIDAWCRRDAVAEFEQLLQ